VTCGIGESATASIGKCEAVDQIKSAWWAPRPEHSPAFDFAAYWKLIKH
jgi:hypothetical protein